MRQDNPAPFVLGLLALLLVIGFIVFSICWLIFN